MRKIFTLFAAMLVALTVSATSTTIGSDDPKEVHADVLKTACASYDTVYMKAGIYTLTDRFSLLGNKLIKALSTKDTVIIKPYKNSELKNGAKVRFEGVFIDGSAMRNEGADPGFTTETVEKGTELHLDSCEIYGYKNHVILGYAAKTLDSCVITNCYFHNNTKGVIYFEASNVDNQETCYGLIVKNSTFANNDASGDWASIIDFESKGNASAEDVQLLVDHCTFYNNLTKNSDHASVRSNQAKTTKVSNCIFAHPERYERRATYLIANPSYAQSCITFNLKSDSANVGHTWMTQRTNCFFADPLFANAANGNLTLAENSPAHEAGVGGTHLGDPRWWPASWQPAKVIPVTSIALDHEVLTLNVNETFYLHTTVLPNNATDPSVTWTSKNNSIATVTNGAVKGIAAGEVMIIAKAGDKADTCTVTVSDTIPSTDFASPYFFMGTKAKIEGNIYVSEADSLHYEDHTVAGTATWKINVTAPCFIGATANFKTGSKSGSKLRVVILDSEDAQVGDSLMQDYYEKDGDKAFTGSIALPKAGIYTVKLVNIQKWSSSKLRGITLTKDASKDVVFKGAWDSWTLHPATTIAADGSSASVKVVLPAGDYDFGVTLGDDFRANGWWLKPEGPMTATDITGNTGNMKVCPALNLEHTFTWTYATNAVTVTFPEVTVYFVNESNWAVVNAYAWREARTDNPEIKNAEWPGIALEPTGEKSEGKDIYSYTFSAYKNIIFNDGSNQTANLAVDPAKPYYYDGDWHETLPGAPTAIDNTVAGEKAVKVLRNGQLFIEKDGKTYNVLGTVVK